MNGEPYGRRVGLRPFDSVAGVSRDFDPVAGPKIERETIRLEAEARGAGQQHDELILWLVVPEARRARLAGRDDALDAEIRAGDQPLDLLLRLLGRQPVQEIAMPGR